MNDDALAKTVNRIGAFFEAFPDENEGFDGVIQHLRLFWTPDMRAALLVHLDSARSDAALSPFALRALRARRNELMHPEPHPTEVGHGSRPDRSG